MIRTFWFHHIAPPFPENLPKILTQSYFCCSYVKRRNEKVISAAVRSTAIVTSMFPSNVRDRLYKDVDAKEKNRNEKGNLKAFLRDNSASTSLNPESKTSPLADYFTETTVLVCTCEYSPTCLLNVRLIYSQPNVGISFFVSLLILQASRRGALFENPAKFLYC